MYTKKQINKIYRDLPHGELKGIIGDYYRLKFSYIPQLLKKFDKDAGGMHTPHRSKLKDGAVNDVVLESCDGIKD